MGSKPQPSEQFGGAPKGGFGLLKNGGLIQGRFRADPDENYVAVSIT